MILLNIYLNWLPYNNITYNITIKLNNYKYVGVILRIVHYCYQVVKLMLLYGTWIKLFFSYTYPYR